MSPDERALLNAVAAAPDDDLPRLVYADWLEEHGRAARAEFIRLQCEIAKLEVGPRTVVDQNVALWKRQQELLDGHRDELLGPLSGLPAHPRDVEFRRGFLADLTLHVEPFLHHAGRIAAVLPPPHVRLTHAAANLLAFTRCPHLGCVSALKAYDDVLEHAVGIMATIDRPAVAAAARRLTRLAVLDLEGCRIGDLGTEWLFAPDHFPALTDLDLSSNEITDVGITALLDSGIPTRLERLVLGWNPVGDAGARELAARLGSNNKLRDLNVRSTDIGRIGQSALLTPFGSRVTLY